MHNTLYLLLDRKNVSMCRGGLYPFYIIYCLYKVLVPALHLGQGLSAVCVRASQPGRPAIVCPVLLLPNTQHCPGLGSNL